MWFISLALASLVVISKPVMLSEVKHLDRNSSAFGLRMTAFLVVLKRPIVLCIVLLVCSGCTFKFELTSQRTALENQILGTYKELDEDLAVASSLSNTNLDPDVKSKEAKSAGRAAQFDAKANRSFNRDDIDDLKSEQILGEARDGFLFILPSDAGLIQSASEAQMALAELLVVEENRDRQFIWEQLINENADLTIDDLADVREEFAKNIYRTAEVGHWLQDENGAWYQKLPED